MARFFIKTNPHNILIFSPLPLVGEVGQAKLGRVRGAKSHSYRFRSLKLSWLLTTPHPPLRGDLSHKGRGERYLIFIHESDYDIIQKLCPNVVIQ
jgi:hypothetical protein